MTLGALLAVGLEADWLRALPSRLGLNGVEVRVRDVLKAGIACKKVDFEIPPQPHGRHLRDLLLVVEGSEAPEGVKARASSAFTALAAVEAELHGTTPDRVHLHEVGAVDAILDVVGSVWGLSELGVSRVYCGAISLGDGFVNTAHGVLPVPAPATLRLLEGLAVRPGPDGTGELVTPTGAALMHVLAEGNMPDCYVPIRSGYGAGSRDLAGRPNALRLILADGSSFDGEVESLVMLASDVDDMPAEQLTAAAESLRRTGALDVTTMPVFMKKGRIGTRIEVLCRPAAADRLEQALLSHTTTIGVRRLGFDRRALRRTEKRVHILGHDVRVKTTTLPDGTSRRKPEHDDLVAVSQATGRPLGDLASLAISAAERE
jgi:uncharacterized protein (TIGR00299 family) protein